MTASAPTDEIERQFRQAYQVIVDRTPLPGGELPGTPLTRSPIRRARGPVVALVAAGIVLALGAIALLTRDQSQFADSVERLALVEPPSDLGGEPAVVDWNTTEDVVFHPLPPADMWIWERADGQGGSMAMFEMEIGADATTLLGEPDIAGTLIAPGPGEVDAIILPVFGWHAASWIADGRWRIAVGYDEAEVGRLAEVATDKDPSIVDLDEFELAYEGPQILQAGGDAAPEVWDLVYSSPAGRFSVDSIRGWTDDPMTVARLMASDPDHVEINGTPAVIGRNQDETWIVWQAGEGIMAFVESPDLSRDLVAAVAEGVRPVSVAEWETIAGSVTTTSTESG
jgi:hypothetical protein